MSGFIHKHSTAILLIFIVCIGTYFRFWNFPNNPPSLNWDEVAIGYNAHSIIETGKDEYGKKLPIYFRSLDDNKLSGYIYLTVLSEYIFGYNDFAVRFPSAFFGTLTFVIVYFLGTKLTGKKQIGLFSALVLAILPWHVQFSRMALEANVAFFMLLAGLWTFLVGIKKNNYLLTISFILFGLTLYTYLSFRVIVPFIVILLFVLFRDKIKIRKKATFIGIAFFALIFICAFSEAVAQKGALRLQGISVLDNPQALNHETYEVQYEGRLGINLPRRFFHELKPLTNAKLIAREYLSPFSSDFLFFNLKQKHHFTPSVGLLYFWMLPFILIGGYFLLRNYSYKPKVIIFACLLLSPIPASITFDVPHAIRTIVMIFPLTILTGIGFYETHRKLKIMAPYLIPLFMFTLGIIIFLFGWDFFRQNQIHLPHERSAEWQYGRREMTEYLSKNHKKYRQVILSSHLESPYIFMLYYSQYNPQKYLKYGGTRSGTWNAQTNQYENYKFRDFELKDFSSDILLVGSASDFSNSVKPIKTIYGLDDMPVIEFVNGKQLDIQREKCFQTFDDHTRESLENDYNRFLEVCK
jgi:4-amino-4-deoxy-L-arabinose transferase-like glycosyltransferase